MRRSTRSDDGKNTQASSIEWKRKKKKRKKKVKNLRIFQALTRSVVIVCWTPTRARNATFKLIRWPSAFAFVLMTTTTTTCLRILICCWDRITLSISYFFLLSLLLYAISSRRSTTFVTLFHLITQTLFSPKLHKVPERAFISPPRLSCLAVDMFHLMRKRAKNSLAPDRVVIIYASLLIEMKFEQWSVGFCCYWVLSDVPPHRRSLSLSLPLWLDHSINHYTRFMMPFMVNSFVDLFIHNFELVRSKLYLSTHWNDHHIIIIIIGEMGEIFFFFGRHWRRRRVSHPKWDFFHYNFFTFLVVDDTHSVRQVSRVLLSSLLLVPFTREPQQRSSFFHTWGISCFPQMAKWRPWQWP